MTRLLVSTLVVAAAGGALAHTPQTPAFRAGTNTVSVYATVLDRNGQTLPELGQDDFSVYDNGVRQQITLFSRELQPITIVVMLDRSGSMRGTFNLVKEAAAEFVTQLLPDDRARLGSFSNRIEIDPPGFTSNKQTLLDVLDRKLLPVGPTPLWNATVTAMDALRREDGRRVVLMFTDGKDNPTFDGRVARLDDVVAQSQREDVMIYAIGLATACDASVANQMIPASTGGVRVRAQGRGPGGGGRGGPGGGRGLPGGIRIPGGPRMPPPMPPDVIFGRPRGGVEPRGPGGGDRLMPPPPPPPCTAERPDAGLRVVADESGGNYFELHGADDLGRTFARVADELHRQYLLAFSAEQLDGRVHRLEVRVNQPGTTVRAKKSYVASAGR